MLNTKTRVLQKNTSAVPAGGWLHQLRKSYKILQALLHEILFLFIFCWNNTSLTTASAVLKESEVEFHLSSPSSQAGSEWLTDTSCHNQHSLVLKHPYEF